MTTRSRKVRVGLVQTHATKDVAENRERNVALVAQAARQGAQIISTQELFCSEYFCQSEDYANFELAESLPGPSTDALAKVAKEHGVVIVGSLFERRAPGLYHNTAVVFDADGSQLGLYRKMHIPDDPLFYEKFYFTPGDLGFKAFSTKFGKVGVLVCWDQWYPEAARLTAMAGAEILFYPTAIGWHPKEEKSVNAAQHDSWQTIQRSHAIANGVFVAAANRIGHEGLPGQEGIDFWGQSFICDPSGVILKKGSSDKEEILIAECDFDRLDYQRTHWPFLRDRRIDAYGQLTQRFLS
jgi:N-carbamoylputrescine amidase